MSHTCTPTRYEELEASFYLALNNNDASAGLQNRPLSIGDDAGHLLDVQRKPYAAMIHKADISLLDFQQYLFARKSRLLFALGRPEAVAENAAKFCASFANTLARMVGVSQSPNTNYEPRIAHRDCFLALAHPHTHR